MSDILEYDKSIVDTLRHIEDVLVKFSLQSYASVGAVLLAYYTGKIPLCISVSLALALGGIFLWAILANVCRYTVIYRTHQIIRDRWLSKEQPELKDVLYAEPACRGYLTTTRHCWHYWQVMVINALPVIAALVPLFDP